jgi:urease accessory protein
MLLTSTDNEEIRLFLTRGQPLLVGEYLQSNCKKLIQIEGAQESVAVGRCKDWQTFARACYHLGNRHVKVQVDALCLMIKPDHVLEKMLMIQGLEITHEEKIFIPESGAYQQDKHAH